MHRTSSKLLNFKQEHSQIKKFFSQIRIKLKFIEMNKLPHVPHITTSTILFEARENYC